MNPQVDDYFSKLTAWREELAALRKILLECGLTEELKWKSPCYGVENHNVSIIGGLKDHCVLSFFKGVLLKDEQGWLEKPGKNTRSGRVIQFTNVREIEERAAVLKDYIREAMEVEKAGLKVEFPDGPDVEMPEEFRSELARDPALRTAFEVLTPGRQRAYLLHFAAAKQSKTRLDRVRKWTPHILRGKGMMDR